MKKTIVVLCACILLTAFPESVWAQYPAIPTLQSQFGVSNVVISWPLAPAFVLQSATNLTGPWVDVTNAQSPYFPSTSIANQFFRLRGDIASLFPPRIDVPQPQARIQLVAGTNALPAGATARFPIFD